MTVDAPRSFPPDLTAVRTARQYVDERLAGLDPSLREIALLLVSELATNSVRHARTSFTVSVEHYDSTVRVAVGDHDDGAPELRVPTAREMSGRGIAIVAKLADDWGVERVADGKLVWFTLCETD